MSDEENPRTRNPDSEKTCDTCLWTNSSKESRNRRVGQAKAIISHKRSLCIECWVMRWSRERSLEPHPCLYLPRPTYPRTQRINGRTTATRIARTSNEEQDYNIITLRGFREREREKEINYYIYENARRVYEGGIAVVFTEVGPLERRPRSTKEFVSRESGERKRKRERELLSLLIAGLHCTTPVQLRSEVTGAIEPLERKFPGWSRSEFDVLKTL